MVQKRTIEVSSELSFGSYLPKFNQVSSSLLEILAGQKARSQSTNPADNPPQQYRRSKAEQNPNSRLRLSI